MEDDNNQTPDVIDTLGVEEQKTQEPEPQIEPDSQVDSQAESEVEPKSELESESQPESILSEPTLESESIPSESTPEPELQSELQTEPEPQQQEAQKEESPKKKKTGVILLIIALILLIGGGVLVYFLFFNQNNQNQQNNNISQAQKDPVEPIDSNSITITGNGIENFDLYFLKEEDNGASNIVYSPLSIKYALTMLSEGAEGESKAQIDKILGLYRPQKYLNNSNLSLANALFINQSATGNINDSYKTTLKDNYDADVIVDSFASPNNINQWVSDKTLGLIKNTFNEDDFDKDAIFYLVNSLAIDMEWVNRIQNEYNAHFEYESFSNFVDNDFPANTSAKIAATANNYDIVSDLTEESIRYTVLNAYEEWASSDDVVEWCTEAEILYNYPDTDNYIDTLKEHYGYTSSSTDFEFYYDDNIKAFAKDLRTYGDTTLEYIGIMPKTNNLEQYIQSVSSVEINEIINKLKPIKSDSFNEGVVTKLTGSLPLFDFEYSLQLQEDLESSGVVDIFDGAKANLSGITDNNAYIKKAIHKANISFSNDGIKAGATTAFMGMLGSMWTGCDFEYEFDVPIEEIDLSFDKPYIFFIIDKDTKEVWFTGAVYNPEA